MQEGVAPESAITPSAIGGTAARCRSRREKGNDSWRLPEPRQRDMSGATAWRHSNSQPQEPIATPEFILLHSVPFPFSPLSRFRDRPRTLHRRGAGEHSNPRSRSKKTPLHCCPKNTGGRTRAAPAPMAPASSFHIRAPTNGQCRPSAEGQMGVVRSAGRDLRTIRGGGDYTRTPSPGNPTSCLAERLR